MIAVLPLEPWGPLRALLPMTTVEQVSFLLLLLQFLLDFPILVLTIVSSA